MLMNLGQACLFNKQFCTIYVDNKNKNAVILPHSAQRKHFFGGGKANININENRTYKDFFLGLLHHRLGHRSINSLIKKDKLK